MGAHVDLQLAAVDQAGAGARRPRCETRRYWPRCCPCTAICDCPVSSEREAWATPSSSTWLVQSSSAISTIAARSMKKGRASSPNSTAVAPSWYRTEALQQARQGQPGRGPGGDCRRGGASGLRVMLAGIHRDDWRTAGRRSSRRQRRGLARNRAKLTLISSGKEFQIRYAGNCRFLKQCLRRR